MNFEKLKSEWKRDEINDQDIPEGVQMLKKSMHPVERLRRSMKQDFYGQTAGIILLLFVPYIFKFQQNLYSFYYIAYSMLVVVSIYYLYSFYRFYQGFNHYEMSTKDSLVNLYYDLRLNIEKYKAFGFLLLPYGLVCLTLFIINSHLLEGKPLDSFVSENLVGLTVCLVIFTAFVMFLITTWVNFFYGKYVREIKIILDELSK